MSAARILGEWVANTDFSSAASARARVVEAIIDTIGCIYAGWRDPVCHKSLAAARQWGTGTTSILGSTERLAMPAAAFINGVAAHALDYDDYEVVASTHNSTAMVPALLALAETGGQSGKDVVDAYIAGFETII